MVPPFSFFLIYLTPITAPIVLFLVFRHWKSPPGLTQRSRWRFVVAAVVAFLQIGGWATLLIAFLTR
jgi:hypothetical protein